MFDSSDVLKAFETVVGVRLLENTERAQALDSVQARFPELGFARGRIAAYDSPPGSRARFGGCFQVSIHFNDRDGDRKPDAGVIGHRELELLPPDDKIGRVVYAKASRANVEVEFWADSQGINPRTTATWTLLKSCLESL